MQISTVKALVRAEFNNPSAGATMDEIVQAVGDELYELEGLARMAEPGPWLRTVDRQYRYDFDDLVGFATFSVASADGVVTSYSVTLPKVGALKAGTAILKYTHGGTEYELTDDGAGAWSGTGLSSATVDYDTGAVVLTFSSAPTSGTAISVDYDYAIDNVREVIGVYRPALSQLDSEDTDIISVTDYGRNRGRIQDQRLPSERIFSSNHRHGDLRVNNEQKFLEWHSNPTATTGKYRLSYLEKCPTLADGSEVPVIRGNERIFIIGVKSWIEQFKIGRPGYYTQLFEEWKARYESRLARFEDVEGHKEGYGYLKSRYARSY